jgi:hypothetical protein
VRGKWSKGIEPRNFGWIIKDQIAICERPGGQTSNHRRVRRHEEIIWIREHGFARVISLMPSPHNLHAYDELNVTNEHVPLGPHDDAKAAMTLLFPRMRAWTSHGERLLIHQDEISDRLQGAMGAYLLYSGLLQSGTQAITVIEHVMSRQLGPVGREYIGLASAGLDA